MTIDAAALQRFQELIRARAGLNLREQETPLLAQILRSRVQALRLNSLAAYFDLLVPGAVASPGAAQNNAHNMALSLAQNEWKQLWVLLTNQESYFCRDAEQLKVIRDRVLPEIRRFNGASRTLRLWSAGCSTGEEPYSLAMMLDEMPEFRDWRVTIVATDISEAALERARRGIYSEWSFRALDESARLRYFQPRGKEWEIAPRLRSKVVFAANNLLGDEFPSRQNQLHDIDLILCRNVFIYFGREAVAQVLQKFGATLRPSGFLVCGHAELHDVPLDGFVPRAYPQSVIYQRARAAPSLPTSPSPTSPLPAATLPARAEVESRESLALRSASGAARAVPASLAARPIASSLAAPAETPAASNSKIAPHHEAPHHEAPHHDATHHEATHRDAPLRVIKPNAAVSPNTAVSNADSRGAAQTLESARAQIRLGRHTQALEAMSQLLERASPDPTALDHAALDHAALEAATPALVTTEAKMLTAETLAALCLMAQAQANAGQLDAAEATCQRALAIAPFAALPYQVRARIAEERGAPESAKSLLKKVIYLNPRSVWGTLELGALYAREGDAARAAQMRRAALGLLEELGQSLGEAAPVPVEEHAVEAPLSIGELKRQLRADAEFEAVV